MEINDDRAHQEIQNILEQARNQYAQGNFVDALELYRQVVFMVNPRRGLFNELPDVRTDEFLDFVRKLLLEYPNSFDVKLYEISTLRFAHRWRDAFEICSKLIESSEKEFKNIILLRRVRFECALDAKFYEKVEEDFEAVWKAGDEHHFAKLIRRWMMYDLSRITANQAMPILKIISAKEYLPNKIRDFLCKKTEELSMLREAWEELRAQIDSTIQ